MKTPKSVMETMPRFWRVFRHVLPLVISQRTAVAWTMLALAAGTVLRIIEPWPIKFIIDSALTEGRNPTDAGFWDSPARVVAMACLSIVVISALRGFADYQRTVGFAIIGNRALTEMRNKLYRHLHDLSPRFHATSRNGDLVVRVIGDINRLKDVASSALLPLLANSLLIIGIFSVMLIMNWRLTLMAAAVLPVYGLSTVRLSRSIHKAARTQRRREGNLAATAAESMAAIHDVQALSLLGVFGQSFYAQNSKSLRDGVKTSRLTARLERTVDVITSLATAIVFWFGAHLVLRSQLTVGELVVFATYLKRCLRPAKDFAKHTGRLAKATAAGERVVELLETSPDIVDCDDAIVAPPFAGHIEFRSVSFGYQANTMVLNNLDLRVPAGTCVAIMGDSGTGKSTLLRLLVRLFDPDSGQVRIDGRDIRSFTIESLRSQVSVLLQDCSLFATDVWENISYGNLNATETDIVAAARLANAHDFISRLPDGYDTVLGERGTTLSRGQRQRIGIARASLRNAPILLLDEPFTGLDDVNARQISAALRRLTKDKTALFVTHNLDFASYADAVVQIRDGIVDSVTTDRSLTSLLVDSTR